MMTVLNSIRTPRSVEALPKDQAMLNYPRRVLSSIFAQVPIQPLVAPMVAVGISRPALGLLVDKGRILPEMESLKNDSEFVESFSGNKGVHAWSHCYWGTQFGNYAGQLGDGAAMLIGESETGFEINLKGSGPTPFSRGFDGRKVLRSSIREFICSEAMAGLGIPSTRAGSIIVSEKSKVIRDINYSGNPIQENCAVVSRIARTFLRFGSFESDDPRDSPAIRELVKYSWNQLLKPLRKSDTDGFMDVVVDRTAFTVAHWQAVGFVHGVMNTDNMSIIGDTIDYGPFGFVETYDPHFVPNTSDKFGRYAWSEQPRVAAWNCERLYEVISNHLRDQVGVYIDVEFGWKDIDGVEDIFMRKFNEYYNDIMRKKLGLNDKQTVSDETFSNIKKRLFEVMDYSAVDYTTVFSSLSDLTPANIPEIADRIVSTVPPVERAIQLTAQGLRISRGDMPEIEEFARTRIHELERVGIDANTIARWKYKFDRLDRFDEEAAGIKIKEESTLKWKELLSEIAPFITDESRELMRSSNPIYIPRQSMIQDAIDAVENDHADTSVQSLLEIVSTPYERKAEFSKYETPDFTFKGVCLSCSS
jgi:uncharacterized protein YdiU (UPF0061 family)